MHLKRDNGAEDLRSQSLEKVLGYNIKAEGIGAETNMEKFMAMEEQKMKYEWWIGRVCCAWRM